MVALFFDVEVLSYRGNARDNERKTPCPITIQGLVTLHNAVVKFKLDTKAEVNLSQYIEANAKLKAEWVGWSEYQRKHGFRLTQIQAYPRLKPAKDGDGDISINPPLSKGKGENLGKVNCALAPINSISFADRHAAANKEYGRTNLSKPTAEQVVNFHSLLFMEIQYLGGCDILWKDSGPLKSGATGGPGGSKNGAPSLSIIASHDTSLDSTEKDNAVLLLKVLAQSADGASTADGASAQQGAGGGSKTQEISIRVFYYKRLYTTVSDSQIQADPSNYNSFPFWPQKLPKTFREDAIQLPLAGKWPSFTRVTGSRAKFLLDKQRRSIF